MRKALFLALSLFAAATAAQAPQPADKAGKPADGARKPLNLKLDQPARDFVREAPPAEKSQDQLPTLGGDGSVSFEKREPTRAERVSPYPKDVENGRY
jgi:hypothetical protein